MGEGETHKLTVGKGGGEAGPGSDEVMEELSQGWGRIVRIRKRDNHNEREKPAHKAVSDGGL